MSMAGKKGVSKTAKSETAALSCYETPLWLVDRIREALGGEIELDPCTTDLNPTKARRTYTPANDGILQPWNAQTIYMNPPYGRTIQHWIEKARTAAAAGSKVIILVPSRTCSAWFHGAMEDATDVLFLRGRLQFGDTGDNAPFPNVIMSYNVSLEPLADLGTRTIAA